MRDLTASEAQNLIKQQNNQNFYILDVRTLDEFNKGHIPGAILETYGPDFQSNIQTFNKNAVYLIYCHSGARSMNAAREMSQLGFKNLNMLSGGIIAWNIEGLPVSTPTVTD